MKMIATLAALSVIGVALVAKPAEAHVPDHCHTHSTQITDEEVKEEMNQRISAKSGKDHLKEGEPFYDLMVSHTRIEIMVRRLWSVIDCAENAKNP